MTNYSINHANLTIVFTTSNHVPTLLKLKAKAPTLKMIVIVDEITADAAQLLKVWADSLQIVFQELSTCEHVFVFMFLRLRIWFFTSKLRRMARLTSSSPSRHLPNWWFLSATLRYLTLSLEQRDCILLIMQGTTNNPKGVVLKHKNLAVATHAQLYGLELPDTTRLLSYLPLAHIYGVCIFDFLSLSLYFNDITAANLRVIDDSRWR